MSPENPFNQDPAFNAGAQPEPPKPALPAAVRFTAVPYGGSSHGPLRESYEEAEADAVILAIGTTDDAGNVLIPRHGAAQVEKIYLDDKAIEFYNARGEF